MVVVCIRKRFVERKLIKRGREAKRKKGEQTCNTINIRFKQIQRAHTHTHIHIHISESIQIAFFRAFVYYLNRKIDKPNLLELLARYVWHMYSQRSFQTVFRYLFTNIVYLVGGKHIGRFMANESSNLCIHIQLKSNYILKNLLWVFICRLCNVCVCVWQWRSISFTFKNSELFRFTRFGKSVFIYHDAQYGRYWEFKVTAKNILSSSK